MINEHQQPPAGNRAEGEDIRRPEPARPAEKKTGKETVKEVHYHYYKNDSRWSVARFIWGIFFILLGLAFLGQNAGWFMGINWGEFVRIVLPVFVIFIGLSVLSRAGKAGTVLSVVIAVLVLLLFAYLLFRASDSNFQIRGWELALLSKSAWQ